VVASHPARVLLIMPQQWPRALLRAELREQGYDAIGARNISEAQRYPTADPERGPVRLVLVDDAALTPEHKGLLESLLARHGRPPAILLARAGHEDASRPWARVLHRPVRIDDIVQAVRAVLPAPRDSVEQGLPG
jgi:DNA-binding response OmpR family regulator